MNFYIAHIKDTDFKSIDLYSSLNKKESKTKLNSIEDLYKINDAEFLLILIPASEVSSYEFTQNKLLSKEINIANFISEVDSNFIDPVSENEYFLSKDAGYVVNKNFLLKLNTYLSNINLRICVSPEYLINSKSAEDVITELSDKFFFSFRDKSGFSVSEENLSQYLDIIINENPNYEPKIYSSNKYLNSKFNNSSSQNFSFKDISIEIIDSLPNFFKINYSLNFIFKKMNFSKFHIFTSVIFLFLLISIPNYLIYINNQYAKTYQQATFDIFKSINKDIKRVIAPKNQIDQILINAPTSNNTDFKLPEFDRLLQFGETYISNMTIDPVNLSTSLKIESMPKLQFTALKKSSEKFGILFIEENIQTLNGKISGNINLKYK